MARVNPKLFDEIKKLGAFDVSACYSCGVCTATCPLSESGSEFPRRIIRYAILGLEDKLLESLEPWLCYYCGDCTLSCPRGADPGEFMMAVRRYLITRYDWTGISKRIYHSKLAKILGIALLMLSAFVLVALFHGPVITDRVALETFAPLHVVEIVDAIVGFSLAAILIGNLYRMYRFTVGSVSSSNRIPFKTYVIEFIKTVPVHFLTQIRRVKCREGSAKRGLREWFDHFILMWGYVAAFLLFAILLHEVQTDEIPPLTNPLMILGIFSAIGLLYGTISFIVQRLERKEPEYKYSHSTDWMFLILLFLTAFTGVLVGIFRHSNMPLATYITYSIHLSLVMPLLILEVPFAKWSHLAYRSFAIYFERLKKIKIEGTS